MGCILSFKKPNGDVHQINSEAELAKIIINNKNTLLAGRSDLINFDSENTQLESYFKLTDTVREAIDSKIDRYDPILGEYVMGYEGNAIHDTNLIETHLKEDGTHLVTPFNISDWEVHAISQMQSEGMSKRDAQLEANALKYKWELAGEYAGMSKSIILQTFNKNRTNQSIKDFWMKKLKEKGRVTTTKAEQAEALVDSLIKQGNDLRKTIVKNHGSDVLILNNFDIVAKTKSQQKVFGTIDLIAVDKEGIPHIYLLKNTTKPNQDWQQVTDKKYDYHLGIKRQMLAANGINVEQSKMYIVPIDINGLESASHILPKEFRIQKPVDRTLNTNENTRVNRLTWGVGEIFENLQDLFTVELVETPKALAEEVHADLHKMIPTDKFEEIRDGVDINNIIKNRVKKSYDEGESYTFNDDLTGKTVKFTEDSPKHENAEIREYIERYVQKNKDANYHIVERAQSDLSNIIAGKGNWTDMQILSGNVSREHIINNFKKYKTEHGWEVFRSSNLNQLGIIVMRNTISDQVDFIGISYLSYLNAAISSMGEKGGDYRTSLAGMFIKDSKMNDNILKATNGNIELIKMLLAINKNMEMFNGNKFKIGEVRVVNPRNIHAKGNAATIADRNQLLRTFDIMTRLADVENNISHDMFVPEAEMFRQQLNTVIMKNELEPTDIEHLKNIKKTFENKWDDSNENPMTTQAKLDVLKDIKERIEKSYSINNTSVEEALSRDSLKGDIGRTYRMVVSMIIHTLGLELNQSSTLGKFTTNGRLFSGTMISQPEHVPDKNFRNIVKLTQTGNKIILDHMSDYFSDFFSETIRPFWEANGFGHLENKSWGGQTRLYKNLYRRNPDGSLDRRMMFKNPYTNEDGTLSESEIVFLKDILYRLNKVRHGFTSEKDTRIDQLKKEDRWFYVPLSEANSKIEQAGIEKYSKMKWGEINNLKETLESRWRIDNENTYSDREYITNSDDLTRYEMYNRFQFSESNQENRDYTLKQRATEFWELNVERLVIEFEAADAKKKQMNEMLPAIQAIKALTIFYGKDTAVDQSTLNDAIDKYVKSVIYGRSLYGQEAKQFSALVSNIKLAASKAMIGFNASAIPRDFLSGTWKAMSLAASKMYLGKEQFSMADLSKAYKFVTIDSPKTMNGTSLIEALNMKTGMSDIEMNYLHNRLTTNKSGLVNLMGKQFWTSTVGDYGIRMITLVATMLKDGSFDAMGVNDYGIDYNWKLDKRFSEYAKGNKKHKDYNKQRADYLRLMNAFNESNKLNALNPKRLNEGDDLPFAYSPEEIISMKSYADMSYGYYSQDVRALHEKIFLGSIFWQFKTYLTTHFVSYFLAPDHYNQTEKAYKFDPKTGKQLYYQVDENGIPVQDVDGKLIETTEITDIPVTHLQERWLQGVVYTLRDIAKDIATGGEFDTRMDAIKDVYKNDTKRSAVVKLTTDLSIFLVLGAIGKALIGMWDDRLQDKKKIEDPNAGLAVESFLFDTLNRGFNKSFEDLSYKTVTSAMFNTEPASLGYANNVYKTTKGFLFGDVSLENAIYRLSAAARTVRPIIQEATRVPEIMKEIEEYNKKNKDKLNGVYPENMLTEKQKEEQRKLFG